jgi:uncharacterized OB-fold protein
MALKQCVECGKELSTQAQECPNCKSPDPFGRIRAGQNLGAAIVLAVVVVFGIAWYFFQTNPIQLLLKASQLLK